MQPRGSDTAGTSNEMAATRRCRFCGGPPEPISQCYYARLHYKKESGRAHQASDQTDGVAWTQGSVPCVESSDGHGGGVEEDVTGKPWEADAEEAGESDDDTDEELVAREQRREQVVNKNF